MDNEHTPGALGSNDQLGMAVNRALFDLACQRISEWAHIGPVQRAALESFAERLLSAERERWNALRNKLQADIARPEGRWGMHGREAVGDDYFAALEWMLERMDEILGPNVRVQPPAEA